MRPVFKVCAALVLSSCGGNAQHELDPGDGGPAGDAAPPDRLDEIIASLLADDPEPNSGWIGGACQSSTDCPYADGICLTAAEGFPNGACSALCNQLCPDQAAPANTTTFCLDQSGAADGTCVSRCDFELLRNGCRDGYSCQAGYRDDDPSVVRSVCLPAAPSDAQPVECYAQLILDGAELAAWNIQADQQGGQLCWVEAPTALQSPIAGVSFKALGTTVPSDVTVSCNMAGRILRFAEILAAADIIEVTHLGTYNCRVIAGTTTLSQHAFANAIDLHELVAADGAVYNVQRDWEYDTDVPVTAEGQFLYALVHQLYDEWVFNVILTPNYNSAHYDHVHVDLTDGDHFLRGEPLHYLGPNTGH